MKPTPILFAATLSLTFALHAASLSGRTNVLTPEEQLVGFTVPEGFIVELVASEKDGIINPIDLTLLLGGWFWVRPLSKPSGPTGGRGKWGMRGKKGRSRCFGASVGGVLARKPPELAGIWRQDVISERKSLVARIAFRSALPRFL